MSSTLRSRRIVFKPPLVLAGQFGHQSAGTHGVDAVRIDPIMFGEAIERDIELVMAPIV